MTQELFRLIPNDHRTIGEDLHVVLKRTVVVSKPEDEVDLIRLRYEVMPLNYALKEGESQTVVSFQQRATLDAILDQTESTIDFSVNEADASLPEELRGGGVGSYILSEMIRWGQQQSPQLSVTPIRISTPENTGSGREAKLKAFFSQLGFLVVDKPGKGVFAAAQSIAHLKPYVNSQKIERVNLVSWGNEWLDNSVNLANQLREESRSVGIYKEQASSLKNKESSKVPFWAGVLCGGVFGLIVGLLIGL
ncbi:MAG: hypothetical protein MI867_07175 [Pseudomonadales bacterium]|nr:hypothetical protein [Pseudomonadales bacterium]